MPGDVKTEILDIDLKTRTGRTVPARLFHKIAFGADGAPGPSRTLVLNRSRDGGIDPQRAAEVRFMRFFQNTPMAIATVDKQGRIADSNARFARLFNPAFKGESSGDRSILAVVAERDRDTLEAAIRQAAEGQGEIAPVDAALAGPGERFASFFVTAIEDEQERDQEAAIVYALETTQQRTLENQLAQQQKMETIGRLAGNIAHDFNNLLGAIMMATDFLLNAHRPTDPSFQDIMQIKQNANRAASLVRQLLAFSRKQTMRPVVLDLGEALSDLTVLLKRLIGENITLNVPQVRDLWPVKADVHQFEQVVINLAINARDAMPLGGTLTLRTGNVGAEESAPHQHQGMPLGEYVRVEVEDTGSGIAPEIIDKIFDPFYTTKDIGKGTGLGLSTVYGIVKQTGGFIFVESELGKGTIFRIFLPRYIPAADDLQAPQLPETTAPALAGAISAADAMRTVATDLTGHGTILLVEDEEELRALNARGLTSRGYTVIEAGNGVEAIEELEKQGRQVDLVVSDVVMPEMDGPTLMKELKQRNPDIKIIFVSGYAEDAFEKSLPDHKQFNFLAKPFTLKQAAQLALMWFYIGNGKGAKNMVILPYKDRLELFSKYIQQLVMESLGKEKDLDGKVVNQGLAVFGNKGSTDQHSYIQQLREGILNFFAVFIEVLHDRKSKSIEVDPEVTSGDYLEGFFLGTRQALYENGRESITLTLQSVTPYSVGLLIALYERAVGLYATLININAYHQPGVEAGKKAAAAVIDLQRKILNYLSEKRGHASLHRRSPAVSVRMMILKQSLKFANT